MFVNLMNRYASICIGYINMYDLPWHFASRHVVSKIIYWLLEFIFMQCFLCFRVIKHNQHSLDKKNPLIINYLCFFWSERSGSKNSNITHTILVSSILNVRVGFEVNYWSSIQVFFFRSLSLYLLYLICIIYLRSWHWFWI